MRVPRKTGELNGRSRVKVLGNMARQALRISGERSGIYPEILSKGEAGQPLPAQGVHWSIAHKPEVVAGVVSPVSAGIDVETLKPVSKLLFEKIVTAQELVCFKDKDPIDVFFKTFTAKEAVLKAKGVGLSGLSRVRVVGAPHNEITLINDGTGVYAVEHFLVDGHVASVVKGGFEVVWEYVNFKF